MALNDRLKLRALMVAEKGPIVYLASEQAAIQVVCPDAENVRSIEGGVPFVVQRDDVAAAKAGEAAENRAVRDWPLEHEVGVLPRKRREA